MDEKDIEVIDLTGESETESETWSAYDDEDEKMDVDSEQSSYEGDHWPDQAVQLRWRTLLGYWRREGITEGDGSLTGLLRALDPFIFGTAQDIAEYEPDPRRALRRIWNTELGLLHEGAPAAPTVRRAIRRRTDAEEEHAGYVRHLFGDGEGSPTPNQDRSE